MSIDLTSVLSSAVTAVIVGSFQYLALRYVGRIADTVEKQIKKNGKGKE